MANNDIDYEGSMRKIINNWFDWNNNKITQEAFMSILEDEIIKVTLEEAYIDDHPEEGKKLHPNYRRAFLELSDEEMKQLEELMDSKD